MLGDGDCHECDDDDGDDASLHPLSRRIRSPVNHPPRVKNPHLIAHDFAWDLRVPHDKAHLETQPRPLTPSPPLTSVLMPPGAGKKTNPPPHPPGMNPCRTFDFAQVPAGLGTHNANGVHVPDFPMGQGRRGRLPSPNNTYHRNAYCNWCLHT